MGRNYSVLSKTKTCYAVSFSGFAGSKAQADPDLTLWENDIVKFIKDKKIRNPVLIGHSMGGTLALQIAANHPDIISKLVVVDAFPSPTALYNPRFKSQKILTARLLLISLRVWMKAGFTIFKKRIFRKW